MVQQLAQSKLDILRGAAAQQLRSLVLTVSFCRHRRLHFPEAKRALTALHTWPRPTVTFPGLESPPLTFSFDTLQHMLNCSGQQCGYLGLPALAAAADTVSC